MLEGALLEKTISGQSQLSMFFLKGAALNTKVRLPPSR
jgi:hypothetical protein